MSNSVTFYSNVWEKIVDEDKRKSANPIYTNTNKNPNEYLRSSKSNF